jgi:N4-gp56 family major capsid protein
MANYDGSSTVNGFTSTGSLEDLIKVAYDRRIDREFVATTLLRSFADKKVVNQTQPGATVTFSIHKNLSVDYTPLNEIVDGNETSLDNPTQISVTVNEYGRYTIYTEALTQFAFDDALAKNVTDTIRTNQLETLDGLVAKVMRGDLIREAGNTATQTYNSVVNGKFFTNLDDADAEIADNGVSPLTATAVRDVVAELRTASVPTWDANHYVALVHPRVAAAFRSNTDAAGWRYANTYVDTTKLMSGEIGIFEGVRFVETSRVLPKEDEFGVDGDGVYTTYIIGRQALAEIVTKEPGVIVDGDITDPYGRKVAIGWYGILGWNLYRPESLYAIKSSSLTLVEQFNLDDLGDVEVGS